MPPKVPKLEFKCPEDQAWYSVAVELKDDGKVLRVHYEEFEVEDDEYLDVKKTFHRQRDVHARFRLASPQLQDNHCSDVRPGLSVCACCTTDGEDMKFFDADILQVHKSEHCYRDEEEECTCSFDVRWLAGPKKGQSTAVRCGDICLLNQGTIDAHPVLNNLLMPFGAIHPKTKTYAGSSVKKNKYIEAMGQPTNRVKDFKDGQHVSTFQGSDSMASLENLSSHYVEKELSKDVNSIIRDTEPKSEESTEIVSSFNENKLCTFQDSNIENFMYQESSECKEIQFHQGNNEAKCESSANVTTEDGNGRMCFVEITEKDQEFINANDNHNYKFTSAWGRCKRQRHGVHVTHARINEIGSDSQHQDANEVVFDIHKGQDSTSTNPDIHQDMHISNAVLVNTYEEYTKDDEKDTNVQCGQFNQKNARRALVLDNLEKDLTASEVMDVLSAVVDGVMKVVMLPTFRFERFTRTLVVFKDHSCFQTACDTFQLDDLFIVSKAGRPWVMLEPLDYVHKDDVQVFSASIQDRECSSRPLASGKIRLVHRGVQGYARAKHLKEMFMDFWENYCTLHRRLAYEESLVSDK